MITSLDKDEQKILQRLIKQAKEKRKRVIFNPFDRNPPPTNPTTATLSTRKWREAARRTWRRMPFKQCGSCGDYQVYKVEEERIMWCYVCGRKERY